MFSGKITLFANRFRSTTDSNHRSLLARCDLLRQSIGSQQLVLQQQAELVEGFE